MVNGFESEVQEAMRILRGEHSPAPSSDKEEFESEVQEAMNILRSKEPIDFSEEVPLTPKRAVGLAVKGFAEVPGSVVDIASQVSKYGIKGLEGQKEALVNALRKTGKMKGVSSEPSESSESISDAIPETEFAHKLGKGVESIFGEELTPKTPVEKAISTTGSFLFPVPIPGGGGYIRAAQAGITPLTKHLGKEAMIAGGASSAIHLTPRVTEEGTLGGAAEDLTKALVGAKSAQAVPGIAKSVIHPIETAQEGLARAASRFIKPEEAFLEKAAKHKIDIPFNVGANSKTANSLANNYFKSIYTSKKYNEALKKADDSVIDAVKRSIDTLGEENVKPSAASVSFAQHLKEEEHIAKKEADELYKIARRSLSDKDRVVPKNTLKALNSEAVKDLVGSLSPSSSEKVVINRIREISNKLSSGEEIPESVLKRYKNISPESLEKIKKQLDLSHDVPVKELINLRKSLLNTLSYDLEVRGSEAFLSNLAKTLDSDIRSLSNEKFLKDYEIANSFFRQNIGQRFRKSMAESILRKESPVEAFNLMNSVGNIRMLERISGENPKSRELFDSLKKAKVREILSGAIKGELESSAEISTGVLGNLFKKGEKKQELLQKLMGQKGYNNLSEISEIASQFSKDGRELLNTSGTAHVLSDINATKAVANETLKTMKFVFGGAAGGALSGGVSGGIFGGLIGAGANVILPNILSRLLSDQKFVFQARAYAIARKQGNEKHAQSIMKRMVVPVVKEIEKFDEEESSE